MTETKPTKYRVLVGINWPDGKGGEKRAEPGATLSPADLRHADLKWFLKVGALEEKGGEE